MNRWRLPALLLALAALGCRDIVSLNATEQNRRVRVHVGERVDVTLQTIGPGAYQTPPVISSPAVTFLDESDCGNPVPAGPTQCFHFRAAQPGQAVITFTHSGQMPTVHDTVDVQ